MLVSRFDVAPHHHFISMEIFPNHVDIVGWIVFEMYLEGVLIFVGRLRSFSFFLERNGWQFLELNTFQILQIIAIENEMNYRTVYSPFVKFLDITKHRNVVTSDDCSYNVYMDPGDM